MENAVGEVIKQLGPSPQLITLINAMFEQAWNVRLEHAKAFQFSAKRTLKTCEKQVDALLDRPVHISNPSVVTAYENKIAGLDHEKALLNEKATQVLPGQRRSAKL